MNHRKIQGKIVITGILECLTGLHIGASKENMEIGALDSPVIRDPITRQPFIPGSSLKGKLRALLEKATPACEPKRNGGTRARPVMRHECDDFDEAANCPVCRLFGSTGQGNGRNFPARLRVRDLHLTADSFAMLEKIDTGLLYTEWKFENALDRITSAANPRNLERVPKGSCFAASLVYDVEDLETARKDVENLRLALRLLEDDALGGHGSRGYGQVKVEIQKIMGKRLTDYLTPEKEPGEMIIITDLSRLDDLWPHFS
jgi:CRISPR-associated protein Csm3